MSFFLQLGLHVLAAHGAVLHEFTCVLFPGHAGFILLVETDGSHSVARFGAKDGEDGALSSWHNGGRLLMVLSDCKKITTEQGLGLRLGTGKIRQILNNS